MAEQTGGSGAAYNPTIKTTTKPPDPAPVEDDTEKEN